MTRRSPAPPRLAWWLLRRLPLGERRDDLEADVLELFASRIAQRDIRYARRRFYGDVVSVLIRPRRPGPAAPTPARSRLTGFHGDLVHAWRLGRRHPTLIVAAVISLGLAMGVSTAVFAVLNGSYLRAYLAADSSVVRIWRRHATGASAAWPASEFSEVRLRARTVALEGFVASRLRFGESSAPAGDEELVSVHFVSAGYLETLGPPAATGRLITPDDDEPGVTPVAVLDHLFWRRYLGGDSSVIGQTIRLAATPFLVVGIADRDFDDPGRGSQPALWAPLAALDRVADAANDPGPAQVTVLGRLAPPASTERVDEEVTSLLKALGPRADGSIPAPTGAESRSVIGPALLATMRLTVMSALFIVGLVLLLASANVSNLLLAGAATRQRELGVRLALGASRRRVIRQLATESVLLSAVGAAVGFVLATWLAPGLAVLAGMPGADVDPDGRVYGFVAVGFTISTIVGGLGPARFGLTQDVTEHLKGARTVVTARTGLFSSALVSVQAAASIVVIVLASLLVRALVQVTSQDPGYDVERLLAVDAGLGLPRTDGDRQRAAEHWRTALVRVRAIPGVEAAALATRAPFGTSFGVPDDVQSMGTGAAYFEVAGLRLLRGRTYTDDEVAAGAPVAVISRRVARRFWGEEDPVGSSLERVSSRLADMRVIGVVADTIAFGLETRNMPIVYRPLPSLFSTQMIVRSARPRELAEPVRAALAALTPEVRPRVWVVADRFAQEFDKPRRYATLAAAIAALALALAVVGLAGVTAFAVRTRRREIGIRMALGARAGTVIAGLLRDGMTPVVIGLAAGLGAALLAGRVIAGRLYDVSPRDPLAMAVAVAILLIAALGAVFLPARRAAFVDPAEVLRNA